jgi:fermentation-respiration switch protein FrsA (DUF1100 family)
MVMTDVGETAAAFDVAGVRIPAVFSQPRASRDSGWAIVLIPGSLHADVDGNFRARGQHQHAYADIARQLSHLGHLVVRFAKHGPETGSVVLDPAEAAAHQHFATRVSVAKAAITLLRERSHRSGRMALAGHSEGSIVASLVAADAQVGVDALISLSGPANRRLDNVREQLARRSGANSPDLLTFDRAVEAIRQAHALPSQRGESEVGRVIELLASDDARRGFVREVDAIDPSDALARVSAPTLIVHGGRDQVVPHWHAEALLAARIGRSLPSALAFFPDLTHMYKKTNMSLAPDEESTLEHDSDEAVTLRIDEWLRALPSSVMTPS